MTLVQWEIWGCFTTVRCSNLEIIVVNDTHSVLRLSSLIRNFVLVAVATALQGPVAKYSRTGSGSRPGDCRPLSSLEHSMVIRRACNTY